MKNKDEKIKELKDKIQILIEKTKNYKVEIN